MNDFWRDKKTEISDYYSSLISQHGPTSRACDYGRPKSQQIKFKILSQVIDSSMSTVLDVGCGFAEYGRFLSKTHPNISYTGVDITAECIRTAKALSPDLELYHLDILNESLPLDCYDVVTANGIFYLLGDSAIPIMRHLIQKMFSLSNHVLAFNSLSAWCLDPEPNEFYADPLETIEFCRSLTPWVVLQHNYHSRDFSVFMYKANPYEGIN